MSMPLTPLDGGVLLPYECHEGNLALPNALSAERAEDSALAEDLAKGIKRRAPRRAGERRRWRRHRGRGAGAAAAAAAGAADVVADPEDAN